MCERDACCAEQDKSQYCKLDGLVFQSSDGLKRSHADNHMSDVQRERELTCYHERTEPPSVPMNTRTAYRRQSKLR